MYARRSPSAVARYTPLADDANEPTIANRMPSDSRTGANSLRTVARGSVILQLIAVHLAKQFAAQPLPCRAQKYLAFVGFRILLPQPCFGKVSDGGGVLDRALQPLTRRELPVQLQIKLPRFWRRVSR